MTTRLPYRTHARGLLLLGLPLVGGHLAQMAIGLTDAAMIGRYGVAELAGLTLATTAFAVIFLFGSGFAWAVTPMIAQYDAEGNHTMIRRATRMSLWLSIGVFLLAMPLMWFSAPALEALGQAPQVARDAQTYLRVAGFGLDVLRTRPTQRLRCRHESDACRLAVLDMRGLRFDPGRRRARGLGRRAGAV